MDIALPGCLFQLYHATDQASPVFTHFLLSIWTILRKNNVISFGAEIVIKYLIIPVIDQGPISRICP